MALARKLSGASGRGAEGYIWPGFVDALATLLMVIIFVLMVFFLIQINLAQRVSGQDVVLERLRGEIASLGTQLNIANAAQTELEDVLKAAILRAETAELDRDIAANKIDEQQLTLAELETRLQDVTRARTAAEDETRASKAEVSALNRSILSLNNRLGQLQALLDEKAEEARLAKEASINLTAQLNNALTSKLLELQRFRSEFFGRLSEILKDRSDIRIVGDRFVFQSEVIFATGSADIDPEGELQLLELSKALVEISDSIPTDIDWVLQVSGHTDDIPINTERFRDNWDLSTERALSVIRYFALAGIDPERLSAAGFGEYHPIITSNNDETSVEAARARNRRIEIKLTRR